MSNPDPHDHPERVLISYSHDSAAHRGRVLALAARLRSEGVDAVLDQYEPHPSEGWPQWMRRQVREATYVLVVCTETYQRRVDLREEPGSGLGATWEAALMIMESYAGQGRNEKFIPVVFSAEDHAHVPDFLQGATRYEASTNAGYEQLYARLTGQELVPLPPLGPRRAVGGTPLPQTPQTAPAEVAALTATPLPVEQSPKTPPIASATDLVLIEAKGTRLFVPAERIREQGSRVEFTFAPRSSEHSAFLSELKGGWHTTRAWMAYGDVAHEGTVEAADRSRDASGERWTVTVALDEGRGGNIMEMGTTGKSVDDIAELRARRILLNEKPPADVARWGQVDTMLETLVQGLGSSGRLDDSPIPALYRQLHADIQLFLAAARLLAVLELRRTETVEHIFNLELRLEEPHRLKVRFRGRRRKIYTNMPAPEIAFEGVCQLE